ncbi:hypothetical protein [Mesorhizobium kowhaii]|uniref:hypothetical protein n=1 Tax=Mesorhizobium kowhaii TaxID=1300272 RepID=UPI00142DFE30|nr:hypothetical protein [Mesorhizobium kowhaii]
MRKQDAPKSQVDKFRDLARKIGATESEEPLNDALRRVAEGKRKKGEKAEKKP